MQNRRLKYVKFPEKTSKQLKALQTKRCLYIFINGTIVIYPSITLVVKLVGELARTYHCVLSHTMLQIFLWM